MVIGEGGVSVKLVLRGNRSVPVLKSLGIDRRFSSMVDAGDSDRGESKKDMETVRWVGGRKVAGEVSVGVAGWLALSAEAQKLWEATHTPETTMNRRRASSVSMGRRSLMLSKNAPMSILEGVTRGD